MMLSDYDILDEIRTGGIIISPFDTQNLKPASYDVHLGKTLLVPEEPSIGKSYDPLSDTQPLQTENLPIRDNDVVHYFLPPGGKALGHTQEVLTLNGTVPLAADIAGCSSLGRWFVAVHMTAGFIDPGWNGQLTLELYNASNWWIRIWEGMRIAQLRFYRMPNRSIHSYMDTGAYYGSLGPIGGKYRG